MKKICGLILVVLFWFAASALSAEIKFNPSWTLKTKDGRYIDITTLTTDVADDGETLLIYETSSGKEGFIAAGNLENDEELIATIEGALERREALKKQPYKPARNRVPVSRPASSSPTGARAVIVQNCKEKWEDDYRMVEYCIQEQNKALASVSQMRGPIFQKCREKWGNDFRMVEYCTNEQREAKRRLQKYE